MTICPNYIATPSFQIGAGPTGPYDCTAHACSDVIDASTCGAKDPGGRTIRLKSSEPIPDPTSPGLNLSQVAAVALNDYGVFLDVHTGLRKVTWEEYERRRNAGQSAIIQLSYAPIEATKYDAFGSTFRGGHAMAETIHATYDPGADGRRAGIWKWDGTVYPRELMKKAAGDLIIGQTRTGPRRVGYGYVWCAFGRDVIPDYEVDVPAGSLFVYALSAGRIVSRQAKQTGGFSARCTPPRSYPWSAKGRSATLVRLTSGAHAGWYISARYAEEVT